LDHFEEHIYIDKHTRHTMSNDDSSKTEIKPTEVKMDDSSKDAPEEESQPADSNEAAEMVDDTEEKEDEEETARKAEEERKNKEELKKKYANWPLRNIKDPHDNDVMYGRGGGTNHHAGNKMYRTLVEDRKLEYVNSKRLDKPLVALEIIRLWRGQLPPGRFLKLDEKMGLWNDVGDKKAREKTSQALREKAPLIRKQQEDEKSEEEGSSDVSVLGNFLLECQVLFLMTFGC
jgi:DNA mismatch repair ATPase MutL